MKNLKAMQCGLIFTTVMLSAQCLAADVAAVLDWQQRMVLSTPVSGIVTDVNVSVGQVVSKNQLLIKLDDRGFRAGVKRAKSILVRATETHGEAKREEERAQELFDRTAISVHDHELVKIEYAKAFASLSEAQAELTQAQLDLEYSAIKSPLAGKVVQLYAHKNQTIANRFQVEPLIVIASTEKMIARASVKADELKEMHLGQSIDVKVNGTVIPAKVTGLGLEPIGNTQDSNYALEVTFDTAGKIYRKGQTAKITLP